MSDQGEFEVPEGSVAAGRRVRLPARAEQPITRLRQRRGADRG